jgi:hypothetical protein
MDLILHLGAHRCGSTAFEQALSANAGRLRAEGIAILKPGRLRRIAGFRILPNIAATARRRPAARVRLDQTRQALGEALAATGASTVVLSDENMLGPIEPNLHAASLYPQARGRLAVYADIVGHPVRRIGVGVRSYAPLWLSAYAYVLRRRPLPAFETLAAGMAQVGTGGHRGWVDLAQDIRAVFPEAELCLWPAETARGGATLALGCALIGRGTDGLRPAPGEVNAGLSADAIPLIHALRAEEPDLVDAALDARLAALPRPAPYRPFGPDALARMTRRYAEDIDRIAALPGVRLLAAPAPDPAP